MKKASLFIIATLILGGLALAGNPNIRTSASNTQLYYSADQMQLSIKNMTIPTANPYVDFYLDNVAGWNQAGFYVHAVSSGNITTADMQPVFANGESFLTPSVFTTGTDITTFKSMFYRMRVYNPKPTIPVTVTMNILLTK